MENVVASRARQVEAGASCGVRFCVERFDVYNVHVLGMFIP